MVSPHREREQVVEGGTQLQGVDHQLSPVGEFEPDDLKEVPGRVESDGEHFGRVGFGLKVDDCDGLADRR
jgi:hypothetical protein